MRVRKPHVPSSWVKLQIVQFEGTKYIKSKSWNIHEITFDKLRQLLEKLIQEH